MNAHLVILGSLVLGLALVAAPAAVAASVELAPESASHACGTGLIGAVCTFTCTVYEAAGAGRCPL